MNTGVLHNVMVSAQEKCSQGSVCNVKKFTFKARSREMIAKCVCQFWI